MLATLAVVAGLLAAGPTTDPAAGEAYVRISVEQPAPTPFAVIHYEISRRGRTTTAVHRRELPGLGESLHAMGLLTRSEAVALWAAVAELQALDLPDAATAPRAGWPGFRWRVEVAAPAESGEVREHSFVVTDPVNQPDRRYQRLVMRVCDTVHRVAGELPFRNVFFPEGKLGWISVTSIPVAGIDIDGFATQLETPLYSYELGAGTHAVRLRTADGALDRTYEVKVEPGGTTHLTVDLR